MVQVNDSFNCYLFVVWGIRKGFPVILTVTPNVNKYLCVEAVPVATQFGTLFGTVRSTYEEWLYQIWYFGTRTGDH